MSVRAYYDPEPATRADLRFRKCAFVKYTHCQRCMRKVELWSSSRGSYFQIDVRPTGETAITTMHRDTCPATTRNIQSDAEALRQRHKAALVIVIDRERTIYAYDSERVNDLLFQACRDAAAKLPEHIRKGRTRA